MTPVKKCKYKERQSVYRTVRISWGQMVSIKERNFHGDLRRITGQNHSHILLKKNLSDRKSVMNLGWKQSIFTEIHEIYLHRKHHMYSNFFLIKNLLNAKWLRKSIVSYMLYWWLVFSIAFFPANKTGFSNEYLLIFGIQWVEFDIIYFSFPVTLASWSPL